MGRWRGQPHTSLQTIIELIAATTTNTGLKIYAEIDLNWYPEGIKITNTEFAVLPIEGHQAFQPEWNYTISPTPKPRDQSRGGP